MIAPTFDRFADPVPSALSRRLSSAPALPLKQVYHKEEEESYGRLMTMIKEKSGDLPDAIFTDFAAKIYKRSK